MPARTAGSRIRGAWLGGSYLEFLSLFRRLDWAGRPVADVALGGVFLAQCSASTMARRPPTPAMMMMPRAVRLLVRSIIWVVTALLMLASIGVIRFLSRPSAESLQCAAAREAAQARHDIVERIAILDEYLRTCEAGAQKWSAQAGEWTAARQQAAQKEYDDGCQQIAARHHMTVAELKTLVDLLLPQPESPTFYARDCWEISVLLADGLLILNMPVYWLLALILFGGWADFSSQLSDAMVDPRGEGLDYVKVYLCLLLCAGVVGVELVLLQKLLS